MLAGGLTTVHAQKKEVRFKHLSLENGLSQSSIFGIVQDTTGFIWLATQDGLNRYDGYTFKVYRNQPEDTNSLALNDIRCMRYDSKGRLWIGTNGGGLDMMETGKEKFTHVLNDAVVKKGNEASFITSLSIGDDGLIWVGTRSGLIKYNRENSQWQLYKLWEGANTSASANDIGWIADVNNGYLYLSSNDKGVQRFDKKTGKIQGYNTVQAKQTGETDALSGHIVISMATVGEKIWIGTEIGLSELNPATQKFTLLDNKISETKPLDFAFVNKIYPDPDGYVWIASLGKGIARIDTVNWATTRYVYNPLNDKGLSHNTVTAFLRSYSGNFWIGTNGNGIDFLNKWSKFDNYKIDASDPYSLTSTSIRAIMQDHLGNTYIGGYSGLSIYYKDGTAKKFDSGVSDKAHQLINLSVYSLLEDGDGIIWIGTEGGGLQKYNPTKDVFTDRYDSENGGSKLPDNNVLKLFQSSDKEIWIGTPSGVARYNKGDNTFINYPFIENGKTTKFLVRDFYELDSHHFWLATDKGLCYFDNGSGKFQFFRHEKGNKNSINADAVLCIKKSKKGDFWIGTYGGGLNKINFKPGSTPAIKDVKHYTTQQGLPSNVIYGILEDNKGNLWMSTNNGICWLDSAEHITSFNIYDNLQSNEFNIAAYYKADDGTMYFGGVRGLNSFNPEKMPFNTFKPKVVITGFKVFNKDRPLPNNSTENIHLEADEDFFSFEFASLDFTIPEKNEYAYKLEGFDDDWVYCGNRHYASYTNLPPGDYVFHVKASNSDHVWNNDGAVVKLTIIPPFWRNKWFLIFVGSVLAIIATIILRVRITRLQEQQKFLEEKVKMQSERLKMEQLKTEIAVSKALIEGQNTEQKRISEDLHDGLGQTLTAANLNLMAMEGNPNMSQKDIERVDSMRQLLQNAIVEVRNISHNLMPTLMAEEGLEVALTELCNRTMKSSKLDIILKVQDLPPKIGNNIEISFYRIVQEIINNTLKHSGAKNLFISILFRNNRVLMETEDNGIGFDSSAKEYKGLGLKNIGIRVEILNGVYRIHSIPGRGTLITIEIPIS